MNLVHLGLGNFFRAHQAWYTEHASDAERWGYAAYSGHREDVARVLQAQEGLYALVARGPEHDTTEIVGSLSEARAGADHVGWLGHLASPAVAVVTVTVTEAGYCSARGGGLDGSRPDVLADVARLREDATAAVATAPARLVAGLAARRRSDAGPVAVVPCDNVAENGELVRQVVTDLAERLDGALADWIDGSVGFVTTVVDRITPRPESGAGAWTDARGWRDDAPVVTEPFSEWVLSGEFPSGRPRWEDGGAVFAGDATVYEQRKLWLVNGAHSLLAYGGSILGWHTVAEAVRDDECRGWVDSWWATASGHLAQGADELGAYRDALAGRFANPRMRDRLARIAEDGSQKLPVRVLPVLRAERAEGRVPRAATQVLAAWLCHLRGSGTPVRDVRADVLVPLAAGPVVEAARRVCTALDPAVGADDDVTTAVAEQCRELEASARRRANA